MHKIANKKINYIEIQLSKCFLESCAAKNVSASLLRLSVPA